MRGHAHGNGVQTGRDGSRNQRGLPKNQGQRPRPEFFDEYFCETGNFPDKDFQLPKVGDMNDERVIGGTPLDGIDFLDSLRIENPSFVVGY